MLYEVITRNPLLRGVSGKTEGGERVLNLGLRGGIRGEEDDVLVGGEGEESPPVIGSDLRQVAQGGRGEFPREDPGLHCGEGGGEGGEGVVV